MQRPNITKIYDNLKDNKTRQSNRKRVQGVLLKPHSLQQTASHSQPSFSNLLFIFNF